MSQKKAAVRLKKNQFFQTPAKAKNASNAVMCQQCPPIATLGDIEEALYPAKAPKKEARNQETCVMMIQVKDDFLLVPGPEKGLLANLYDFPNTVLEEPYDFESDVSSDFLKTAYGVDIQSDQMVSSKHVGKATHIFSHIKRTMNVEHYVFTEKPKVSGTHEWVSRSVIESEDGCHLGMPATVKKALALLTKGKRKDDSKSDKKGPTKKSKP